MSTSLAVPACLRAFRAPLAALLAALLLTLSSRPAVAVSIDIDYDETDRPSFDPNGDKLMGMMGWLEAYYERILTNMSPQLPKSFSIEVWWEDLPDGNGTTVGSTLARTEFNPFEVDIVFDTKLFGVERNWFIDETPMDDSEFNFADRQGTSSSNLGFGQNLFRDLSPADQQAGYSLSPHGVLEVGYQAFARSGGPAAGKFDLWSTALHEMGHVMAFEPEIIDDDNNYDFYDFQHGGVDAAIREDADSDGHAAPLTSLMCEGCGEVSLRRLPAAADLLAMARGIGFQNVNLPRVDFIGERSSDWNDTLNWIGGKVPDFLNEVFIRNGTPARITSGANTARALFVYDNSSVLIAGDGELQVAKELRVGNLTNGTEGQVHVGNLIGTPVLEVDNLNIDKGLVNLASQGALLLTQFDLRVKPQGTLMGAGQVEVQGELNNDGQISAGTFMLFGFGGDLLLRAIDNGKLDLDGGVELVRDPGFSSLAVGAFPNIPGGFNDEHGSIAAVNGNLLIASPLADSFSGTAAVGAGRKMHFFQPWGFGGTLALRGGATADKAALLTGAEIQFGGTTNVETGFNTIDAPLVTGAFTRINVRSGARLNLATSKLGPAASPSEFGGNFTLETGAALNVSLPGTSWTLRRTMTMAAGSTVTGDNIVILGRIAGAGSLDVVRVDNAGAVAPAFDLRVPNGLYKQTSAGRLEIDLTGLGQGVSFDILRSATAELAGTLAVKLADNFLPAVGTTFDILTASSITGAFSSLQLQAPENVSFGVQLVQQLTKVSLRVTQAHFASDFDFDGDVDGGDFMAWMNASGSGVLGPNGAGDADGDLDADGADMMIVQRQLGRRVVTMPIGPRGGVGGGTIGGGVISRVPEPGSAVLALGALAAVVAARRRRV
jgi:hypothetical protein